MPNSVDDLTFCSDRRTNQRFQDISKRARAFINAQRKYKKPDFNRMILDLQKLGWTHEKIAFVLPVANASTVSEWARGGAFPNFENGEAFIMLWRDETGIEREPREGEWQTYQYEIGQLDLL
ncbi:hypothetical protein [Acinetobacter sp. CAAS 2-6]|uniref:hypothetical protein n=1 Tax=Acinetobacter sp. CAAS 2-6 TaxID=3016358 RepID=UPI002DD6B863|nr:hypothetical protein [Acinetobacter sp. CAAS 2-6]